MELLAEEVSAACQSPIANWLLCFSNRQSAIANAFTVRR
jgi:hypothetical protein